MEGPSAGIEPVPLDQGAAGWLRQGVRILAHSMTCPFLRLQVENPPDLGLQSPVILAPNHCSFLDPPVLQMACRHHLTFLMTEGIYSHPLLNPFFRMWGAIPVPEERSPARAIRGALRAIRRRRPVVVFPEGRISLDGCLNPGRRGVVTIMVTARVPVIPVALLGTFRALPRHARMLHPGPVTVRFGSPLDPPEKGDRPGREGFAARIMEAVHALGAPRRPPGREEPGAS